MAGFEVTPNYDGSWSPHIFALQLVMAFYASTCLADIANTDYQGEITGKGSKVVIALTPELDIHDYIPGQELDYQNLDPNTVELYIDKAKYFAMNVDDVFKKQWNQAYDQKAIENGAQKMKIAIETDVFANIYLDVAAANKPAASAGTGGAISNSYVLGSNDATPVAVASAAANDAILGHITGMAAVLDEQNIPRDGKRWLILPTGLTRNLKMSGLKNANEMGDDQSVLRKGAVGTLDGFTIYNSNLLPYVTAGTPSSGYKVYFGHKSALTFATQLTQTDVLVNPKSFGTVMRSLNVYGYKVVKPEAIGVAYLKIS